MKLEISEHERSVLTNALEVARERFNENAPQLDAIPGHERLAAQFRQQSADCTAMIAKLEEMP